MMRKLLFIPAAAIILSTAMITQIGATKIDGVILGDVNGDGVADVTDVTFIQMHAAGLITLTGDNLAAADVDGSGIVDVIDATNVQRYSAGIGTEYPIGEIISGEQHETTSADDPTSPTEVAPTTKKNYELPFVPVK